MKADWELPASQGLPEYGVLLTGTPGNPIVENHSGKTVIAYVLKAADQNGRGRVYQELLAFSAQPAGIPDGGAIYVDGNVPVKLAGQFRRSFHVTSLAGPMQGPVQARAIRQGPIVTTSVQNVVFADSQFVGADEHGTFESFGNRIEAIAEFGLFGKTGVWTRLKLLPKDHSRAQPRSAKDMSRDEADAERRRISAPRSTWTEAAAETSAVTLRRYVEDEYLTVKARVWKASTRGTTEQLIERYIGSRPTCHLFVDAQRTAGAFG